MTPMELKSVHKASVMVLYFSAITCHYNISKYSFTSKVVNTWKSLPHDVFEADTIDTLKNRLDKYWSNQDVLYNFNADFIGTGSLPNCM